MTLTVYDFRGHPSTFSVTKVDAPLEECSFFLDLSRLREKKRWFGIHNKWIGRTVGLSVPIVHIGEKQGGYAMLVVRGEPYFKDIQAWWKRHRGSKLTLTGPKTEVLDVIADFGRHFPENC